MVVDYHCSFVWPFFHVFFRKIKAKYVLRAVYGVEVRMGDETARRANLTASRIAAGMLMEKLIRGQVTPAGLGGVVEDWLAGG